jgi:hypothetical protein
VTRHSAFALRPGSKFRAWDKKWKVISNHTLDQVLELKEVGGPSTKRVRYQATTQITCYWVPFNTP